MLLDRGRQGCVYLGPQPDWKLNGWMLQSSLS